MEPLLEIAIERATEKARAEAKKKTHLHSICSLMETMNMTAQQAMDALKLPADKQKEYLALI